MTAVHMSALSIWATTSYHHIYMTLPNIQSWRAVGSMLAVIGYFSSLSVMFHIRLVAHCEDSQDVKTLGTRVLLSVI